MSSGSATTVTKYYFLGGMLLAKSENNVLTYLHSDHLGSVVLEMNAAGNIVNDQRYYAYGRRLDAGGDTSGEQDFTGQRKDATGLVYMNARYYDPTLEQFISPDTIVPDENSWVSYNRYLYAAGNPLKYRDPTGHFSEEDIPLLCQGCKTWSDVERFFGSQEILTWLQNPLLTFGSQLLAGDAGGATDQFAFLLSGQHDPATMTDHFHMVLWDMNKQQVASLKCVFQQFTHITAWSTNTEVDRGGYFYTGLDRGFTSEDKARSWGSPPQVGIADLGIRPPSESWTGYQLYTDVNERLWEWIPILGKPSSFLEAAALAVDVSNFVADVQDLSFIDNRYPVIYQGSPILGNRNLGLEIDRPQP